ncbi:MAG: carboxypeptidase-like regulatory domain-containing protein [Chloroflexaceae bacterium]
MNIRARARGEASITGQVRTADGAPIADAVVMITGSSPPHPDIAALTDEQGRYRFDGLIAGRYTLQVNATGYVPRTGVVQAHPDEIAWLDFVIE